jgi:hypothetical protein
MLGTFGGNPDLGLSTECSHLHIGYDEEDKVEPYATSCFHCGSEMMSDESCCQDVMDEEDSEDSNL